MTEQISLPFSFIHSKADLENFADKGIRHRIGDKPEDYLKVWLMLFRPFGYATKDDSWGELEKILSIVFAEHIKGYRVLTRLFPGIQNSAISNEMVQLLIDLRERSCIKCPDCDTDYPGKSYSNSAGYVTCKTCNGSNWIYKHEIELNP